jgi:hypothetical protein
MKPQRFTLSLVMNLFRLLLPVFLLGAPFANVGGAPVVNATKDDGVPAATQKISGSTFTYTNTITNSGATDATGVRFTDPDVAHTTLSGAVKVTPIAFDDAYNAVGNTQLTVNAAGGLLANDIDPDNLPHVGTNVNVGSVTRTGGTVVGSTFNVAADGSFTYLPGLGGTGTETFSYLITDSDGLDSVTPGFVTFTVSGRVWYVVAGGSGDGRSTTPSGSPSAMSVAANLSTDVIYVYFNAGSLDGAFTLGNGVRLNGEGVALVVNATTLRPAGSTPVILNSLGDAVTLGQGNTLAGFNVGNTSGKAIVGASVGALSVGAVSINTTGAGVDLTGVVNPAVNVVLGSLTSGGGTKNVNLVSLGGTVNLGGGALSAATNNAFDVNGGNATVSYSGTITNTAARAVNITNRTGGTITLSGLVTSAGVGTGVNLTTNTGATINFTGGMSLSTGISDAFTATGGGTLNATQNNTSIVNTITTTTGRALNVASTTIGASGLTFRSISSTGGTNNGVILDTTGASGGLTVTGNGAAGTGGTIQGKLGANGSSATQGCGIYLNNTVAVSLSFMDIEGCQNYGIRGLTVGGFTLANSTVGTTAVNGTSNVADAESGFAGEGSIRFTDLTGTASITGCTLDGGLSRTAAFLVVAGGTMNLTIDGSTVRDTSVNAATTDALYVGSRNASTANLTVTNACQFTAYRQYAIQTDARDTSTMAINIDGSTFANSNAALVTAGGSLNLGSSASTDTLVQFNIQGNSFRHGALASGSAPSNGGAHLVCGTITGAGKFDGKFLNNTVGVTGVAFSGAGNGADALRMFASGNQGTTRVTGTTHTRYLVQGNVIKRYGEVGILLNSRQGNAIMDATVFGNTINEPGAAALGAFAGIWANCGALGGDTNTMNLVIGSFSTAANKNTLQDSDPNDFSDVFLENDSAAGTAFNLFTNGSAAVTVRQVLIDDNNPTLDLDPGDGFISGTITLQTGVPSVPPLLFAAGGVEKAGDLALPGAALPVSDSFTVPAVTLPAGREAGLAVGNSQTVPAVQTAATAPAMLTQAQLDGVVSAALARWEVSGLTKEQVARLRSVSFEVADLPGWYLGEANGNRLRVDNNAGGNGWHVDASPESDAHFGTVTSPTRRYTDPAGAPAGRIDLLTAVLHEMGHALGLEDSYLLQDGDSIMYGHLTKGERRLPRTGQAVGAQPQANGVTHFLAAPIDIGTLPAGKAVSIIYTVQVENPITPGTTTQTSSQGTVSSTSLNTDPGFFNPVLTDDPTVGGAADPTVTLLAPPPTVTPNTANLAQNAPVIVINGTNFSTTPANNTVVFNLGAAGTVTSSTTTQLTVSFTTPPSTTGALTANVSTFAGSSGAVQVATIVPAPTVTLNTADLAQNAPTIIIAGTNFSATPADNTVVFNLGATGTVTAATPTQLTVTFTTPPSATGPLTANVTVFGGSSGVTQVATIVAPPTVTLNTANRAINAPTILIAGTNFSTTPANNTVAFNLGATGTVTAATATQLTVTFTAQPGATGSLTAVVTSNGGSSGAPVQVATIVPAPTVTMNTANLLITAPSIIINGTNFSGTPAENTVVFNLGATGTVTASTPTQLTVTFTAQPSTTGPLTANVTTFGGSSGAVQVATIISVTITPNTANLAQNATQLIINGTGFSATPANNTVVLSSGTAIVTASTATQLTCTLGGPPALGALNATVTVAGSGSAGPTQVATIVGSPTVTPNTANRAINAPTIIIAGTNFSATPANNTIVFNLGAAGTITAATPTQLTVSFTTPPSTTGPLTANVTVFGGSSGATQVATIVPAPTVTLNTADRAINAPTIVINGTNFSATPANNTVAFNLGATGSVTAATATQLTVTFSAQPGATGPLTANVTTFGGSSGATQVATIVGAPTVTMNTTNIAQNAPTIVIGGTNFSATPANNTVVFNLGAAGTVTGSTATQLTVTFTTPPSTTGPLTAVVTSNGGSSGAPVQVATVVVAVSYVVTTTGSQIVITDTGSFTDTLTVFQPSAGNIQFSAAGRGFTVNGGPPMVGSSGPLSLTGITQITMNAGTGADNVVVSGFTVTLPSVTIGSAANKYSTVSFTGAFTLGSTNSLTAHASGNISSAAAGTLAAGGNITLNAGVDALINGNINHPTGADATLTVRAGNNIDFISGADVTSTSNRLNVVLNSNSDASGTGAIRLQSGTVITSNGGDITLGGGANPLTTPALGNATIPHGIFLDSATLTAGAGAINLRGQGAAAASGTFNGGVTLNGTALVQTTSGNITSVAQGGTLGTGSYGFEINGGQVATATGAINITGTAGSAASGNAGGFNAQTGGVALLATGTGTITVTGTGGTAAGTFDVGVQLTGNTAIQVANGAMVLNGTATSGNSAGVRLSTTDSGRLLSTGSGTITVTGTGTGNGFGFHAGANSIVGGPSATGVITFINDTFDLTSGTPSVQSTATVNVRQKTNGVGIDLGGNDRGAGFTTATNLGVAAGYSVLTYDSSNTSNSAFQGAPIGVVHGDWKQSGGGATSSQQPTIVYLSPGYNNNGPAVETTVYDAPRLNAAWTAATTASTNMAALPPTTVLGSISANTVVTKVAVGNYVVSVTDFDLKHGESLTLSAPAGSTFVVNVSGDGKISGDGSNGLLIAGGLGTSDVVYNFTGTGEVLKTSGGNGSIIQGNLLAPNGSFKLNSAVVTGEIIVKELKSSAGTITWAPAAAVVLGLADVELDRITTPTVNVGDANSGPIFFSKVISPANYKTLAIANNVSFAPTGGFASDIGPTATDIENITVTGTVTINDGATLTTAAKGGFVPVTGQSFRIITNDLADAISGTFAGLSEGATISGFLGSGINAHITYVGGTGNDLVIYTGAAPAAMSSFASSGSSGGGSAPASSPAPSSSAASFASPAPAASGAPATTAGQNAGSATGISPLPSEPILLQTQKITNVTMNANGSVTVEFTGLPGYTYGLQYTPDMVVPWMTIGAVTADSLGEGHVVDTQPHSGGPGNYRLVYPYVPAH